MTLVDHAADRRTVTHDLYRNIHKGIRAELFAAVVEAGRLDPVDATARAALAVRIGGTCDLLVEHAEHEDGPIPPVLEEHAPELAARIAADHELLDARIEGLRDLAEVMRHCPDGRAAPAVHRTYLELASFTSAYLEHQDFEEVVVMPAIEAAIGTDAVLAIHGALIGAMDPDELARGIAVMLPAMNDHERTEMLGGMQADAPPEVFAGVWELAQSVLDPADSARLGTRLGIT